MSRHYMYDRLRPHIGHSLECVAYGNPDNPQDICIECVDCNEVLISVETLEEEEQPMNTAYDRITSMTQDELSTLLRNIYLMGVLDERRNGALGIIDPYCNIPSGSFDDVDYPLMLHKTVELYTIAYTTPFGTSTFGVFKSWDEAFTNISRYACYTLTRIDFNTFRDGRDTYEIIKL